MKKKGIESFHTMNTHVQEAYRALRTNLLFSMQKDNVRSIAVTSCNPGEGKTTTSLYLSIFLAKSGRRVLLVDADLRKPASAKNMDSSNVLGLTSLLSGQTALEEAVNETEIENFSFIGCGPEIDNPTEMLESNRFSELIQAMAQMYDLIIFDTPPLGSVIDSAIIASRTDGALLVVKSNSVGSRSVLQVKEQLEKSGARLLGAVLNRVSKKEYKHLYGYYNYYGNRKRHR